MGEGSAALVESAGQADLILSTAPRPSTLVAVSPCAAARLEERGAPYLRPEDLRDEGTLAAASEDLWDLHAAWTETLDGVWAAAAPPLAASGFRPARAAIFEVKATFDAALLTAHLLEGLRRRTAPRRLVVFAPSSPPSGPGGLEFDGPLSAFAAGAWASALGWEVDRRDPAGDERFRVPPSRRRWTWSSAARKLRHMRAWAKGGPRVLLRPEYDVDLIINPLCRRGLSVRFFSSLLASTPPADAALPPPPLSDALADARWQRLWSIGQLDGRMLFAERLRAWLTRTAREALSLYGHARRRIREDEIRAVVTPFTSGPEDAAILQAAAAERVPVLTYQHGGFAGACLYPRWEHQDLRNSNEMLFYGDGSAGHFRKRLMRYPDARAVPRAVGSARLDRLAGGPHAAEALRRRLLTGRPPGTPLVLYFPTHHMGYARYLSLVDLPDVSHWELQRDIVRLFARHPGVRLVYKPFEGRLESPARGFIARELPDAVVIDDAPLTELMWAVDALVCDTPSTGLLECLLTDKPVVVMSDARVQRLDSAARRLLERRAAVASSPRELIETLDRLLAAGPPRPLLSPDRSFLRAYGTHLDDGGSAERAAAAVAEAARA